MVGRAAQTLSASREAGHTVHKGRACEARRNYEGYDAWIVNFGEKCTVTPRWVSHSICSRCRASSVTVANL